MRELASIRCAPRASGSIPLVVTPRDGREPALADVRAVVEAELSSVGAVLFRAFPVDSAAAFDTFARTVTPELVDYEFGSTPRTRRHGQIYTSTEYPAHQHIPLHNEQSYTSEWPLKIWFHCAQAALEGGATPIADSREVYARIPSTIRERFETKRVMYVRNYGNGLDLSWEQVFGTDDPQAVTAFCERAGIECEWRDEGELRTRQICQAVADHPETGARVWFNQAHLFHVSNLEPVVREGMLAAFAEDEIPRNAFYGDGTPIEEDALEAIREVYREVAVESAWETGDVLLLDNMLVAHGRAPFRGPRSVLVAMAEPVKATTVRGKR